MSLKYVSLHNHTTFSLYDGFSYPEDYIKWMLKNAGDDSGGFAITEHGSMNSVGHIAAAQKKYKSKDAPVKLIYGVEAYYIPSLKEWRLLKDIKDKEQTNTDDADLIVEDEKESKAKYIDPINRRNHLVLLAQNQTGLKNLFRLVSRSYRKGLYRKPRIDFDMLKECHEGLVASSACLAGIGGWCSAQSEGKSIEDVFALYDKELFPVMELFGKDRFYLELQFNRIPEQQVLNNHLVQYAARTNYKLIATCDAHYPSPDLWRDRELYRLLGYNFQKKEIDYSILDKTIDDLDCHLYLKNGDQMFEEYKKTFFNVCPNEQLIKEAIERTYDIAHNFIENVSPDEKVKLPKTFIPTKEIKTSFDKLKELCIEGLKKKGLQGNKVYFDRCIYELKIIKKLGFEDYFLTLKDSLDEIRKGCILGVGRGSGAGSLVNYLLEITMIDPVKNNLLFERFLSAARKEFPDIDNDVEDRDTSISILKNKYGEDDVLLIVNYNVLKLKSLVKDLSRLYQIPFEEVNEVTKVMELEARDLIMEEIGHDQKLYEFTFDKAKQHSPSFNKFLQKYPKLEEHITNLYKQIRNTGVHAGGVCILPNAEDHLPIVKVKDQDLCPVSEGITTQNTKFFGVIKYDFLGLATLKIIKRCIELILKEEGIVNPTMEDVWEFYNEFLHPDKIDSADQKVFENVYQANRFPSIFQFAEVNVQTFCVKAQPKCVADISAITSIWRPGPLGSKANERYLENKHKHIEYEHEILKEVLSSSYGLLIYQEQFMLLANKLAGFSLEEADKLRKLLVKPSQELGEQMKKERIDAGNKFIKGCMDKGLSKERAEYLWYEEILHFISYGFNASHSFSYAYNSYQCAYLFTYYEKEWLRAVLECDPDPERSRQVIAALGYKIAKPDVNNSEMSSWVVKDRVCYAPFVALKGVGDTGADELLQRRNGGFKSLMDFLYAVNKQYKYEWRWNKLNKRCIDALIQVEALDSLGCVGEDKIFKNYKQMKMVFDEHYDKIKKFYFSSRQNDGKRVKTTIDFNSLVKEIGDVDDWTNFEKIAIQKELLGVYDRDLLFTKKTLELFNKYDVQPLSFISEEPRFHWFIVKEVIDKVSRFKTPYKTLKICDIDGVAKTYNYFGPQDIDIVVDRVYCCVLWIQDGWINGDKNKRLIRAA